MCHATGLVTAVCKRNKAGTAMQLQWLRNRYLEEIEERDVCVRCAVAERGFNIDAELLCRPYGESDLIPRDVLRKIYMHMQMNVIARNYPFHNVKISRGFVPRPSGRIPATVRTLSHVKREAMRLGERLFAMWVIYGNYKFTRQVFQVPPFSLMERVHNHLNGVI